MYVRFEVFTAVTMKNAVLWDVAACRSCVNRRFGGTYRLHLQGRKISERGTIMSRWLQTVNLHNLQYPLSLRQACCVFTSRFVVTASNSGNSSASTLKSSMNGGSIPTVPLLHRLPYRTDSVAPTVFLITLPHGPPQKTPFPTVPLFKPLY
jgi:hypothetical protein